MKVLVTGSRGIDDYNLVADAIDSSPWDPSRIIHGTAEGVDQKASAYAAKHRIDEERHPVPEWLWETLGKRSGPMRNGYMVGQADVVVAVWDGESPGTKDTIQQAQGDGLPVYKVCCSKQDGRWIVESEKLLEDDQANLEDFAPE